jgi:hypothetical protein
MHANKTLIFTHDFTSSPQGRRGLHGFCVVFFWGGGGQGQYFFYKLNWKNWIPPVDNFFDKKIFRRITLQLLS